MNASKFSDAKKALILKQGTEGMPVAELCCEAGISQATYFNWKKRYDGLLPTERCDGGSSSRTRMASQEAGCRPVTRQREAAGSHPPKALRSGPEAQARRSRLCGLERVDPEGLCGLPIRHVDLPLRAAPTWSGPPRTEDQGNLRAPRSIRAFEGDPCRSRF